MEAPEALVAVIIERGSSLPEAMPVLACKGSELARPLGTGGACPRVLPVDVPAGANTSYFHSLLSSSNVVTSSRRVRPAASSFSTRLGIFSEGI